MGGVKAFENRPPARAVGGGTRAGLEGGGSYTFRALVTEAALRSAVRAHGSWLLLAAALAGAACDPHVSIDGSVTRADAPVEGAKVRVACSSLDGGEVSMTTDSGGKFATTKIGCVDKGCTIDVTVTGEPVQRFPSAPHCVEGTDCCDKLVAHLELEPAAP